MLGSEAARVAAGSFERTHIYRTKRWLAATLTGLVVALIAAFVFVAYQIDISAANARIANASQIVDTRCGPIEYATAGTGPTVLIVHGAGGGFDQGMRFGMPLVERGFRVVAMSRFGYLRTPLPSDASAAAQADAHACLIEALGIHRVAIIGASAGAPSAIQFALRYPKRVSRLVLMVPAVYVPRPDQGPSVTTPPATQFLFDTALRSDFLFWAATRLVRETLIESILATPARVVGEASAEEQERVQETLDSILPIRPRRIGLVNDASVTSALPRYELERVTAPTLAISCADDRFGTYDGARYTTAHIPNARFIGFASGGHLWVGHQREILSAITQFLTAE